MIGPEQSRRAAELAARRAPFVVATVVRAQRPTSVRAGDTALVLADGSVEGFVGGTCSEQSLRLHALRALETGEPLLLRIVPGDGEAPASEGAVTVANPCLSGGAMEIFLEPVLPAPRVAVVGETPVAGALARLGAELGLDVVAGAGEADLAVVVASHGRDELGALRAALEAGVPYVGLVASRRRGAAVAEELAGTPGLERLETPAGLDIGARTPEEIALSILARIVEVRRTGPEASPLAVQPPAGPATASSGPATAPLGPATAPLGPATAPLGPATAPLGPATAPPGPATAPPGPATALDPVCGMTVVVSDATPHAEHAGRTVWFCCDGCRATFERDPDRFASAL